MQQRSLNRSTCHLVSHLLLRLTQNQSSMLIPAHHMLDPSHYRSLAGTLQYFTFTRPDIACDVQQVCLFMHDPREEHMHALKRIVCYIQGTFDHGLHPYPSFTSTLLSYTDADWGGCLDTRRSTLGYCVFLGPPNGKLRCHDLVWRRNNEVLPMWFLSFVGYETFF